MTLLLLLVGADPDLFNLSLTADGILVAIAISVIETGRSRRSRLIHGFLRTRHDEVPDVRRYVLSARAREGNPLNDHRVGITFSQRIAETPTNVHPPAVSARRDPDDHTRLKIDIPAAALQPRKDVTIRLRFEADPTEQGEIAVTRTDVDPQSSDLQPRDLTLLRPRAYRRVLVAGVLALALLIVGVVVSRFVPVLLAPLAGRILIVLALVPVGIAFANSRILDRY